MRRILTCIAIFMSCVPVITSAQDATLVPGLLQELRMSEDDTARAEALANICFNLIHKDQDSARLAGEQALALATRINAPKAIADAHNDLGWLDVEQGNLVSGENHLLKALAIYTKRNDAANTSAIRCNLGWLAEKRGDEPGAMKNFIEALHDAETARDSGGTAILLYSIGTNFRKAGQREEAIDHLQRALAMERALGRTNKMGNCLIALGNTFREQGDTARAMENYGEAVKLYSALKDHQSLGLVEENIGDLHVESAPVRALKHYAIALAQYDSVDSRADKAYVLKNIGLAQMGLGQLFAARTALESGLALAQATGATALVMDYEHAFAELASKMGDSEGTREHYERYLALKDSLQGADNQRELARLRTAFYTERKEKDNAVLRAENGAQQQRLRSREVQLFGSIALALLALVAALLFRRNFRQKRKHAATLEALNAQLANTNAEINEINGLLEMKLLRSQMNPHFIYNGLNSAARLTQAGHQAEALSYLQGFSKMLRSVLDHSVKDRVSIDEELEFLRQYLKIEAQRLPGLTYQVEADPELLNDYLELPALLVQPFVENAVWHGLSNKVGERFVQVLFIMNGAGISCVITDTGVGRNAAAAEKDPTHNSLGMQLTGERLRLLTRRLGSERSVEVEDLKDGSGVPKGTRVTIHLPALH